MSICKSSESWFRQILYLCRMASIKPSVPKGTRDFSPAEMAKRNFIFDTIKGVFRKYGYQQIETPSMELNTTLMGKYGEEGDKLIFNILNSGELKEIIQTTDSNNINYASGTSELQKQADKTFDSKRRDFLLK